LSESRRSGRKLRAKMARRIGHFLGIPDLRTSVHALQGRFEAQGRRVAALRDQTEASKSRTHQLEERLETLDKGVNPRDEAASHADTSAYVWNDKTSGLSRFVPRRVGWPRLFELFESTGSWHTTAESMFARVFEVEPSEAAVRVDEARLALGQLRDHTQSATRIYPEYFTVEGDTALFLFAAIRHTRPSMVLETGVADGLSTALMLRAMEANGVGELHSVDISENVGMFVSDPRRWHLHVVDTDHPDACLHIVKQLPTLDMFLHDGNHEYAYQSLEYRSSWPRLRHGGLLLSDDIDWSYAFLDFIREHHLTSAMLMDNRKVFGLLKKI
jgi:predicted O-methyltransferase YrrM